MFVRPAVPRHAAGATALPGVRVRTATATTAAVPGQTRCGRQVHATARTPETEHQSRFRGRYPRRFFFLSNCVDFYCFFLSKRNIVLLTNGRFSDTTLLGRRERHQRPEQQLRQSSSVDRCERGRALVQHSCAHVHVGVAVQTASLSDMRTRSGFDVVLLRASQIAFKQQTLPLYSVRSLFLP